MGPTERPRERPLPGLDRHRTEQEPLGHPGWRPVDDRERSHGPLGQGRRDGRPRRLPRQRGFVVHDRPSPNGGRRPNGLGPTNGLIVVSSVIAPETTIKREWGLVGLLLSPPVLVGLALFGRGRWGRGRGADGACRGGRRLDRGRAVSAGPLRGRSDW